MPFKRIAIFVHRWLGVALCLFFLLWFPSGIGMMYWDFPSVTGADRLDRSPALDPSTIHLSPVEAFAALEQLQPPTAVHLITAYIRSTFRGSTTIVPRGTSWSSRSCWAARRSS